MNKISKKKIGSTLDDFLQDDSSLSSNTALAIKRGIACQITEEMKAQNLTKTELAKRMCTSRSALDRLLDEQDASLTLATIASAAAALGKRVDLRFT
jgi:predicted XRE-type DNA-binding protein